MLHLSGLGTPVEKQDANTPAVFGNYIDIYDISQAVDDKVTVRIFYESRLAKVNLTDEGKQLVEQFDAELDEVDETDEAAAAKMKWAKLEAIVGNPERICTLANDIIAHFEERQTVFEGKALIVAMSRRIAALIYDEIIKLRPEWHNDELDKGFIKVVMTSGSSDGAAIQKHHTTKSQRKALAQRLKDENDPLKIVIVRDMWLTGFDAPCFISHFFSSVKTLFSHLCFCVNLTARFPHIKTRISTCLYVWCFQYIILIVAVL